jgi:hypothetical protein
MAQREPPAKVGGESVEVEIEPITGKERDTTRSQALPQRVDELMSHALCAGAELKHRKNLREGINGQPEPQHLCGAAQPGAQFVQLEVGYLQGVEAVHVQGLSVLTDGFRKLMKTFRLDYLFLDTHPGLNEETLLSILLSDTLVLVLRPDQQDFQGTAVTVEVARKLKLKKLLLVVNKALPKLDFESLRQQVQKTYNAPVAGILPVSEEMIELGSAGLFSLKYPEHPFSQGVREIAAQVLSAT